MVQRYVSSDSLRDEDTRSLALGDVRVLKSIVGRIRYLAEMATGRSIVDGEEAGIPRNPQGLLGVDLSGPPYGPCVLHSTWWFGGMKPDTSGAGEWAGQRARLSFVDGATRVLPVTFRPKAFADYTRAPMSRAYPSIVVYRSSSAAVNSITVTCLQDKGDETGRSQTFTLANSTSEQTFVCTSAFWDVRNGRNRELGLRLETTATTNVLLVRAHAGPTEKLTY